MATKPYNSNPSASEHPNGACGEFCSSRYSPQFQVSQRKAEALSSSDCPSEPASRRAWTRIRYRARGAGHHGRTSCAEQPATRSDRGWAGICYISSRARQPATVKLAVQVSGQRYISSAPAASPEAAPRRMSLEDMSGPLCGMPDGTIQRAQVASNHAAPAGKRQNKTLIFVSGVKDT